MSSLLETENLSKDFGGVRAVCDLDIFINRGEIVGMIGPNGSGKTTFINLVSRIYPPTSGTIKFKGVNIEHLSIHKIIEIGIARTCQNLRLFSNLSVIENVLIGRHCQIKNNLWSLFFNPHSSRKEERKAQFRAMELLEFVGLSKKRNELAKNLAYGEQKCLELARALASDPELLLLDEPMAGMNLQEMTKVMNLLLKVREKGKTLFIVEHNMKVIMNYSDRVIVLNAGKKIKEATPIEVQQDKKVQEVYLGERED